MKISIRLIENNNEIIANCPELDINCYAADKNEALRRIRDVIHFYVDSARELGLSVETLQELSIEGEPGDLNLGEPVASGRPYSIN